MTWTRAMALGIAGVLLAAGMAPTAGAGPCEPPLTLDDCDLLVSSRVTNSVLRFDGVTGDYLGDFVSPGSGGLDAAWIMAFVPEATSS
jgi:hypothetical protein